MFPTTIGGEDQLHPARRHHRPHRPPSERAQADQRRQGGHTILSPNLISTATAVTDVAAKVPVISVAWMSPATKRGFVFRSEPSADLMVQRVVKSMVANGVNQIGFIGFSDSWVKLLLRRSPRPPTARSPSSPPSATAAPTRAYGGAVKIMSAKPDAVFVGASGTRRDAPDHPARAWLRAASAIPRRDQQEFLRVGKAVEGLSIQSARCTRWQSNCPTPTDQKNGVAFVQALEAVSRIPLHLRGARLGCPGCCSERPRQRPEEFKAKPGTPEFAAVRENIEKNKRSAPTACTACPPPTASLRPQRHRADQVENNHWKAGPVRTAPDLPGWRNALRSRARRRNPRFPPVVPQHETPAPRRVRSWMPKCVAMLGQDGVTSGTIYALLALALVLVFAPTRLHSSGELLYGRPLMAALEAGAFQAPSGCW